MITLTMRSKGAVDRNTLLSINKLTTKGIRNNIARSKPKQFGTYAKQTCSDLSKQNCSGSVCSAQKFNHTTNTKTDSATFSYGTKRPESTAVFRRCLQCS